MEIIHIILGKANPSRMNGINKVVYQLASKQAEFDREASIWGITKNAVHDYGKRNFETKLFKASLNPFYLSMKLKKRSFIKKGKGSFPSAWRLGTILCSLVSFLHKKRYSFCFNSAWFI